MDRSRNRQYNILVLTKTDVPIAVDVRVQWRYLHENDLQNRVSEVVQCTYAP